MKRLTGACFNFCHTCGAKIPVRLVARPFSAARLCPGCVDLLPFTTTPVHQKPHSV